MKHPFFWLIFVFAILGCNSTQFDAAPPRRNESVMVHFQKFSGLNGVYFLLDSTNKLSPGAGEFNYHLNLANQISNSEDSNHFIQQILDPRYMEVRLIGSTFKVRRFGICSETVLNQYVSGNKTLKFPGSGASVRFQIMDDSIRMTGISTGRIDPNATDSTSYTFAFSRFGPLYCIYSDQQDDLPDSFNLAGADMMRYLTVVDDKIYDVKADTSDNDRRYSISQIRLEEEGFEVYTVKCDSALKTVADSLGVAFNGRFHFDEFRLGPMFSSRLAKPYFHYKKINGFELPGTEKVGSDFPVKNFLIALVLVVGLLAFVQFFRRS